METKTYIFSWGGGVNSTAILAMIKLGMLPELTKDNTHIVFADTGAEMPYTYEHTSNCLQPMSRDGWRVKVLRRANNPELYSYADQDTLPEYCMTHAFLPSAKRRDCTHYFKSNPIKNYKKTLDGEVVMILGIANDEKHRVKDLGSDHTIYPLIDQDIDRAKCLELCIKAELPTPKKSGCYLCPLQTKAQWLETYRNHKELFVTIEKLEENKKKNRPENKYYIRGEKPIMEYIRGWLAKEKEECRQGDLFELDRHCLCEL